MGCVRRNLLEFEVPAELVYEAGERSPVAKQRGEHVANVCVGLEGEAHHRHGGGPELTRIDTRLAPVLVASSSVKRRKKGLDVESGVFLQGNGDERQNGKMLKWQAGTFVDPVYPVCVHHDHPS